jgi:predicted DNA-binding antitoxin AbrB/MazE fold protein
MEVAMRTIRAIYQGGRIKPLEPIDLPENTRLAISVLESDDVPVDSIAELARGDGAFDFLKDPREDIYSDKDGEAV